MAAMANHIPLLPVEEHQRRRRRADSDSTHLWALLDQVKDPEIPVISIWELGVLQDIEQRGGNVIVTITPTYSGCPAMDIITEDIAKALASGGYPNNQVVTRLSPAWSTSWIAEEAQQALRSYGIAPPGQGCGGQAVEVRCPQCDSDNVRCISEFGSTACKALYQCSDCREPFDLFKPL